MNESAPHLVDEDLRSPASYLTIRPGDRVYDLFGWVAGTVVEPRIATTREQHFDGIVVDVRGREVFVDAPEVRAVHEGVVILALTVADLSRTPATTDAQGRPQPPPRRPADPLDRDDAVALLAALSRLYAADRVTLATLEREVERILRARTCGELDAIAAELPATSAQTVAEASPGGRPA